jgi:hypothetical protein
MEKFSSRNLRTLKTLKISEAWTDVRFEIFTAVNMRIFQAMMP